MVKLFYPCCGVGETVPYKYTKDPEPLKSNCWVCGDPDFIKVTSMGEYDPYRKFINVATMVQPTDEPPPWSI